MTRTTAALSCTMHRHLLWIAVAGACGANPTPARPAAPALDPAAAPAPAPAAAGGAPCFPDQASIRASDMFGRLETFAWSVYADPGEPPPPTGTFGTCRVERNVVHAADGTRVAELSCGVRILVSGIEDDLGLQLGARGQDVLDRKPQPLPPLRCFGNGPDQVRCMFDRADDVDTDPTSYVVGGALPPGADALDGADAIEFFAARTVVEINYSAWCH